MRIPICGGNWNDVGRAGLFALNLNNPRSNLNGNVGFRSALPITSDIAYLPGMLSVHGCKGICFCRCVLWNKRSEKIRQAA